MSELRECPFCGGKAYLERADKAKIKGNTLKVAYVRCNRCFARTGRMTYNDGDIEGRQKAKYDAVAAWNMRCK